MNGQKLIIKVIECIVPVLSIDWQCVPIKLFNGKSTPMYGALKYFYARSDKTVYITLN